MNAGTDWPSRQGSASLGMAPAPLQPAVRAQGRRLALRRVAMVCAVLMLAVVSLSAFLRLSKLELSCAQWPQCHGQSLRKPAPDLSATQGQDRTVDLVRLAHRVLASTALSLVLAMVLLCLAVRPRFVQEGRVALVLLALALGLSVLGIWSSDPRMPAVAMANLLGGFAMLALSWRLSKEGRACAPRRLRAWAWAAVALLAWQIALGAMVSAPHAASTCKDLAGCIGAAFNAPEGAGWNALDPWREPMPAAAALAGGATAQAVHRLSALAVLLLSLPLGLAAMRHGRVASGVLLLLLLAAALELGLLMAGNGASLPLTLMHNGVSALLLATAFELTRGPEGAAPS